MEQGSFKELDNVIIKSTYSMEINDRSIDPGETILAFDSIQIANFQEIKTHISAKGGYKNAPRVFWDDTKEVKFAFVQGVFSKEQFALMNNAGIVKIESDTPILINRRRRADVTEDSTDPTKGVIYLKTLEENYDRIDKDSFVIYDQNWNKVTFGTIDDEKINGLTIGQDLILDYVYKYTGNNSSVKVGRELVGGFLSLQGITRIQEDSEGAFRTALINIPKFRLTSNLSMSLGRSGSPIVSSLEGSACPCGGRGSQYCMEIIFLDDLIEELE